MSGTIRALNIHGATVRDWHSGEGNYFCLLSVHMTSISFIIFFLFIVNCCLVLMLFIQPDLLMYVSNTFGIFVSVIPHHVTHTNAFKLNMFDSVLLKSVSSAVSHFVSLFLSTFYLLHCISIPHYNL